MGRLACKLEFQVDGNRRRCERFNGQMKTHEHHRELAAFHNLQHVEVSITVS